MTQATDTDIRDIKTSIDNLTKVTELIARSTEANGKAITDITLEMRVGFANVDTKFANVTTQITHLDSKIDNLEIKLDAKIDKLETKIDGKFDTVNARLTNIETNTRNLLDLAEKIGELKNWKQIAIVVFTASVSGAIAWYLRGGSGNP